MYSKTGAEPTDSVPVFLTFVAELYHLENRMHAHLCSDFRRSVLEDTPKFSADLQTPGILEFTRHTFPFINIFFALHGTSRQKILVEKAGTLVYTICCISTGKLCERNGPPRTGEKLSMHFPACGAGKYIIKLSSGAPPNEE